MNDSGAGIEDAVSLSVLIVCHEMAGQIGNTLESLLPPYQREIERGEYEIILIDNGSAAPLSEQVLGRAPDLRYIYIPPNEAAPSPAAALNRAATMARAELLCLMIDGARMLSPGVLSWGMRLMRFSRRAAAEARGWHIGPKFQPQSIMEGYDAQREHELLEKIRWRENGYRLFEISTASAQTRSGLAAPPRESNCLFLTRAMFEKLGGFDERYSEPGGGFVNLDFYARLAAEVDCIWSILGEGTFHQVHRGAATGLSVPELDAALKRWAAESERLRGRLPEIDPAKFILAGHLPPEFRQWLAREEADRRSQLR